MENKEEKPIPSPYVHSALGPSKEDEHFLMTLDALCKMHGHKDYFFAFATKASKEELKWVAFSTILSKSMVGALETIIRGMRQALTKIR